MPFPIIPALIAAGSAIAGGAMGSASNRKTNQTNLQIARETNQMNYQLFQESNAFNEKMYHEANAYNTPSAQMQRYAEAGINPYIAAGNVQTGNTTSALQSAPAPQMHAAQMQPDVNMANGMMSAGSIISQYAQNELAIAQARKTNSEANWIDRLNNAYVGNMNANTGVLNSQTGLLNLDAKLKHDTLGNYIKLSDLSVANAQETNKSLILQNVHQDLENKLSKLNLGIQDKYAEQMFKAQLNSVLVHTLSERMHIGIDQQNANTNRMNASTNRLVGSAEIKSLVAGAIESAARTAGIKIDNVTSRKIQDYVVDTYHSDAKTASTQAHISYNESITSDRDQKHYNANNWVRWISGFVPFASGAAIGISRNIARPKPHTIRGFR